jgi:hypothetical protein
MKIFFLLRHSGYLRNYDSVVRLLAEKGNTVHLGFFKIRELYREEEIERLLKENSNITYGIYPKRFWLWSPLVTSIRLLQTYLRFLDKSYGDAHKLRSRAESMLPSFVCLLLKFIVGNNESRIWFVIRCLSKLEQAIPADPIVRRVLRYHSPDVFLVTPLIDLGASQLDWVKSAKAQGIKTGLCVASWDNLTNKSLIQIETDVVIVWNEIQKSEAVSLHRIPAAKVVVTGAQCYDRWFENKPSTTKEEFLRTVGLIGERLFILYLCSSRFIAPNEIEFVEKWIETLRSCKDSLVRDLGVLIRPHPQNASQWEDVDLSRFANVEIYPREGANPVDEKSVNDFLDSIYHSVAAVGINTSTMIEAGIFNKPVFTMLSPDFKNTQEGTLHFHYLVDGGLLYISNDLDEHLEQLSRVLNGRASHKERIRNFIESFIRPQGLDTPSTPIFVEAIENLSKMSTSPPEHKSIWGYALIGLLSPFAVVSYLVTLLVRKIRGQEI